MDLNQNKKRTLSSNELFFAKSAFYNRQENGSLPTQLFITKDGNKITEFNTCIIRHVPMRLTRSRLSYAFTKENTNMSGLRLQNTSQRRESFLYKYEEDSSFSPEKYSRQTSMLSKENNSTDCVEDIIVTPFAQILAVLHRIRTNVSEMPELKIDNIMDCENDNNQKNMSFGISDIQRAKETMYMLDWCLTHLENIQTDRSVSSLATVKFKKMLNFELNQYDEESRTDHQISDYICNTFLDDRFEREDNYSDNLSMNFRKSNSDDSSIEQIDSATNNFPLLGIICPQESRINKILENSLDTWCIDLFEIHDISHNVLTLVTYAIFKNRQINSVFHIPNEILINFLLKIEATYKDLPYHNSIHAADVIQTANVMLKSNALQNVFTDLEIFSVLFACVIHDVDHPGVTNQFLINTSDHLATLYNDQSVLENHHLATSFSILKDKRYDILLNLTKQEKTSLRKLVIDMVLATDMSRHMNLLADLKTMVETKKVSGSGLLDMDKYNDRVTILQNLVHCADLSNPTKPRFIYEKWVSRIMEEFYLQGDREKSMGLDVSAMCERENSAVDKTQVGFIDYIVHPIWESWSELVHPDAQMILESLADNRLFYFTRTCPSQTITEVDSDENEGDDNDEEELKKF